MDVSMNPEALGRGATQFTNRGDEVGDHAATVDDIMAVLAPAFSGAGQHVWQDVVNRVAAVQRQLRATQVQLTDTGGNLGALGQAASAVDQAGSNSMGTGPR